MPKIAQAIVSGHVLAGGQTVKICSVELLNESDDIVDTVLVDEAGRYSLNLSAGKWTLRAWDVEGRRGEATINLKSGVDVTVDIALES